MNPVQLLTDYEKTRIAERQPLPDAYLRLSDSDLDVRIAAAKAGLADRLVILGHHYQRDEVIKFADVTGDSLKLAQTALWFGVDDMDGTVQEERIYHMAGSRTPEALSTDAIERLIRAAGRVPVERDTFYNVVTPQGRAAASRAAAPA